MSDWLQQSFQENSILWLLLSSILGGVIGASARFVFDVILPQQLQQKRQVIAVKRKYRTPILLAAEELRRRLENMIQHIDAIESQGWLSDRDPPGYYYPSTLYVVGQFFGWLQILRRTVVYLDFTTTKETRQFEGFLEAIEDAFSSPALLGKASTSSPAHSRDKWVVSYFLQAIGAWMIIREDGEYRTRDYASFYERIHGPEHAESFKRWFAPLGDMFHDLKADDARFRRIVATHAILNAFIEHIDPRHLRTQVHPDHWELLSEQEANRLRERIASIVS